MTKDHLTPVRPGCTPPASSPAILTAETEAEFAAALNRALETGEPIAIEAPLEVRRAFGMDLELGPDSAEELDIAGWPDLVPVLRGA